MTLQALTLTTFAALGLVGFVVSQLQRRARRRSVGSDPDRLSLTFQTSTAKAKQGWARHVWPKNSAIWYAVKVKTRSIRAPMLPRVREPTRRWSISYARVPCYRESGAWKLSGVANWCGC